MKRPSASWIVAIILVVASVMVLVRVPPRYSRTLTLDDGSSAPGGSAAIVDYLRHHGHDVRTSDDRLVRGVRSNANEVWLLVNPKLTIDTASVGALCHAVRRGGTAVLVAHRFDDVLTDSFGVDAQLGFGRHLQTSPSGVMIVGSDSLELTRSLRFVDDTSDTVPSVWTSFLVDEDGEAYGAYRPFGAGRVIALTIPDAFSNINLLRYTDDRIIRSVLERAPEQPIVWDRHYKPDSAGRERPLAFLSDWPGLEYAYWVLVITGVGMILVNMRRRQRVIPLLPVQHDSVSAFVDQITMVYWNRGDHAAVARQMLRQFRLHCVRRYRLSSLDPTDANVLLLHHASGCSEATARRLLTAHAASESSASMTERTLIDLHADLEHFFRLSPP